MSTSPYFQSDCRPQFAVEGFLFSYFSSTAPVPTRQNTCWIVQMYFEEWTENLPSAKSGHNFAIAFEYSIVSSAEPV